MRMYGFYIDTASCSGCKTCQVACQDKNDLDPGLLWRKVIEIEGGEWKSDRDAFSQYPFAYHISLACNHCENPLCVRACPTQAMHVTDLGTVSVDQGKCIGCSYCTWACPYDAPRLDHRTGRMSKCDMCYDRIINNENPVCVDACPMRALDFGYMDELQEKYGDNRSIYPLASPALTRPSVIIRNHKDSLAASGSNAEIANREEI
ncbi:MAG: DMSO/selenate family reductase complex B subunit [Bacteroidales bacterium]